MTQVQATSATRSSLTPSSTGGDSYRIERGDTLSSIAKAHGTSVAALLHANPQIHDANRIYPGDVIAVPAGAAAAPEKPSVITVHAGDTLSRLASTYDTDVATLARLNGIQDPNLIHVGDRLRLPGSTGSTGHTGGSGGSAPPTQTGSSRSWMDIARGEVGQKEIAGSRDNARIVKYHQTTTLRATEPRARGNSRRSHREQG